MHQLPESDPELSAELISRLLGLLGGGDSFSGDLIGGGNCVLIHGSRHCSASMVTTAAVSGWSSFGGSSLGGLAARWSFLTTSLLSLGFSCRGSARLSRLKSGLSLSRSRSRSRCLLN